MDNLDCGHNVVKTFHVAINMLMVYHYYTIYKHISFRSFYFAKSKRFSSVHQQMPLQGALVSQILPCRLLGRTRQVDLWLWLWDRSCPVGLVNRVKKIKQFYPRSPKHHNTRYTITQMSSTTFIRQASYIIKELCPATGSVCEVGQQEPQPLFFFGVPHAIKFGVTLFSGAHKQSSDTCTKVSIKFVQKGAKIKTSK